MSFGQRLGSGANGILRCRRQPPTHRAPIDERIEHHRTGTLVHQLERGLLRSVAGFAGKSATARRGVPVISRLVEDRPAGPVRRGGVGAFRARYHCALVLSQQFRPRPNEFASGPHRRSGIVKRPDSEINTDNGEELNCGDCAANRARVRAILGVDRP